MNYRVEITSSAEADIDSAYSYMREDSAENAERWRQGLYDIADTLSRFPDGCSYALENEHVAFEVRQKLYGRWRVLFTIESDRVIVLSVRHSARLPMKPGEIDHASGPAS